MALNLSPFNLGNVVNDQSSAHPDAGMMFLKALLQGQETGVRGFEEAGRNSRSSAELDIQKQKIALDIQREKTKLEREKALGALVKEAAPVWAQSGGAAQMVGGGQPQPTGLPPQGSPQQQFGPQLTPPAVGVGEFAAPQGGGTPMARWMDMLTKVPDEMVPDFMASTLPNVAKAQERFDLETAFSQAEVAVADLLTPQQRKAMAAGKALALQGASFEEYSQFMPKAQLELSKAVEEAKAASSKKEADAIAFPYLVRYGVAAPDAPPTNAADKLYELRRDMLKDAREARAAQGKADYDLAVKGLEGIALDMAVSNRLSKASDIFKRLRSMPLYDALPDGVLLKVANEAPRAAANLEAPRNEREAMTRSVAGTGLLAYSKIEDLVKTKNTELGMSAYLAGLPATASGTAGAIAGVGAGMKAGTTLGKMANNPLLKAGGGAIGAGVGGLLGAGVGVTVAPLAEMSMSSDQQELYTAAQDFMDMVLRPRTGAVINAVERLTTMQTYLPFKWDTEARKKLKTALRARAAETTQNVSGLPADLASDILKARRESDRQLLGIPEDGRVEERATTGRVPGQTDAFFFRPKGRNESASDYMDAYEAAYRVFAASRPQLAPSPPMRRDAAGIARPPA